MLMRQRSCMGDGHERKKGKMMRDEEKTLEGTIEVGERVEYESCIIDERQWKGRSERKECKRKQLLDATKERKLR